MGLSELSVVWGQSAGTNPGAFSLLALRRWYTSLTLSSPDPVPSLYGLWSWLAGLGALLLVAMVVQGPGRALGQLFDLPGHFRLLIEAGGRLRRSGRLLAVTIGMTVVAWTASQTVSFAREQGKTDLLLLLKSRGLRPLAIEQGIMAALTPLRDVVGLGDNLLLLVIATVLVFRASVDRMSGLDSFYREPRTLSMTSGWETVVCGGSALYSLYRLVSLGMATGGLPPGGCLIIEGAVVPMAMLMADSLLLAWVLVELRSAGLGDETSERINPDLATGLMPGAALACLAAMPARYVATGVLLASMQLPASATTTALGSYVRWQLNWGLAELQGAAVVAAGLAGAVVWSRGTLGEASRGYGRMLAADGGRLVAVLAGAGLAAGSVSAVAYLVVLSLPASTWALAAADSYAHYATLPIGLLTLAALVELGERALPEAALAGE